MADTNAQATSAASPTDHNVWLRKSRLENTDFYSLVQLFHNQTERFQFNNYLAFIDRVMCHDSDAYVSRSTMLDDESKTSKKLRDIALGSNAYQILRTATEVFLVIECGLLARDSWAETVEQERLDPGVASLHQIEPVPDSASGSLLTSAERDANKAKIDPKTGALKNAADKLIYPRDRPLTADAVRIDETRSQDLTYTSVETSLRTILGEHRYSYINTVLQNALGRSAVDAIRKLQDGRSYPDKPFCDGTVLASRGAKRFLPIELIWSYWHEEGMLVQTMNAISLRFQNVKGMDERDPLSELEIDPLRPLGNLMWGYIQDEQNRLTVKRRAYEYQHHYGLMLVGKALPNLRPADIRSKFLRAWHDLLRLTWRFYEQDADTTKISDGFPVLNAAKEVHLILAHGAHNQFGDLPWTARVEMLMQEWLLARTEMREFLRGRFMIPYTEPWMGRVDAMKRLKNWSDVTVQHFRDLAFFGERLLLTLRYGNWNSFTDQEFARLWARFFRQEVQGYIHAYRAVTGVDLTRADAVDATLPAIHLRNRLAAQLAASR